ncbi:hypothetical protein NDI39_26405 [Microcoleus sp. ZQ-A2]|nr:hypothetical protein [Microcoleus sp. FACHB-1]
MPKELPEFNSLTIRQIVTQGLPKSAIASLSSITHPIPTTPASYTKKYRAIELLVRSLFCFQLDVQQLVSNFICC